MESLYERLESAKDGDVVEMDLVSRREAGGRIKFARQLPGYAVQAWCELVMPHRNVRVMARGSRGTAASGEAPVQANEVLVVVPAPPLRPAKTSDG